jgi:dihydrofolate reductase
MPQGVFHLLAYHFCRKRTFDFKTHADRLELTLVEGDYEGDTYFPAFEPLVGTTFEQTKIDERDGFRFVTYERIGDAPTAE